MKLQSVSRKAIGVSLAIGVLLIVSVFYLAFGWYFGNQFIESSHPPPELSERVIAVKRRADHTIVSLAPSPGTTKYGTYGAYWSGGEALLGPVLNESSTTVERELLRGLTPPSSVGISFVFGQDPMSLDRLPYSEVVVHTELGTAPAWYIPAAPSSGSDVPENTWVIAVHGSNANRRQFLRFIPELHRCGVSVLDITYRNDVEAPGSPDHLLHLGLKEWRDLDSAVQTARAMGAKHVVLFGGSMGGAIVLQYLVRAEGSRSIAAVVLEGPMLSPKSMIEFIAMQHHLPMPGLMSWVAILMTNARLGEDIRQIDAARSPRASYPPMLIMQGLNDRIMPSEATSRFVANLRSNGNKVQYVEFPKAEHGGVWNSDPIRTDKTLGDFLSDVEWNHAP
jgi:uncharacterized protein